MFIGITNNMYNVRNIFKTENKMIRQKHTREYNRAIAPN